MGIVDDLLKNKKRSRKIRESDEERVEIRSR